jgi:hypothetical protein
LPSVSSPPAAHSSPPSQIVAATPPKIVPAPSNLFDNNKPSDNIFISPPVARPKWDPIKNGKLPALPQDNKDFTDMIPGGLNKLLERQGEQNDRGMHNILSNSANRQKLRWPFVSVPMGLPSTSADWNEKDSDEWCRKHVPDWHSGNKISNANGHHLVTTASNDVKDKMTSYANEDGKQLYKIPQRQMKSDKTYAREDFNLALSLRRNSAAAAAAASAPSEASNWE